MNVIVIGGNGREHALAWKLRRSRRCNALYAAPGNAGIAQVAELLPIAATDGDALAEACRARRIDLAVVGPEGPLAAGLGDRLRAAGIAVFGPSAAAARIESSKAYARRLMTRENVAQPEYEVFNDWDAAGEHLRTLADRGVSRIVVKASGLAAGKGAIVCDTLNEAREAARQMLVERAFGDAGAEVLIEERLVGREASLFVLSDGAAGEGGLLALPAAQDYKRALEGDHGPNTGGMGCYAPAPHITPALTAALLEDVVRPTLRGLNLDGNPYQGCLYVGLILTDDGPKVIEHNARFGDPETQALVPLMASDLLPVLLAAATGDLGDEEIEWSSRKCVVVAIASGGYPGAYSAGLPICGLADAAALDDVTIFHAGTAAGASPGEYVTAGGRVLNVAAVGDTYAAARQRAYEAVDLIHFEGCFCRRDIAAEVA